MRFATSWLPRPANTRSSYVFIACAAAIGLHTRTRTPLRNDGTAKQKWAGTRCDVEGARQPSENGNQVKDSDEGTDEADDASLFHDEDSAAWQMFSSKFSAARASVSAIKWSDLGDKVADQILPEWVQQLPSYLDKVHSEMAMSPGSLADEIWQEAQDSLIHPEIALDARVRVSGDLCAEELAFIRRRKRWTTAALADYLDISPSEVDPRDVPTIAICGSGGGLRALVSCASSYLNAQEAGLFDCATYTAGVSGSCWLQTLFNSSLGGRRLDRVIEHLKRRLGVHIAYPPSFLELLTTSPINKYLLAGTVERLKGDTSADFGLVDIYGLLLASRLLVPKDELNVQASDMKLSQQRMYLKDGSNPLPVYAAVRHEIPLVDQANMQDADPELLSKAAAEKARQEAWFQWFEFTPYELWCEELSAGIPAWSVGRHFQNGRTVPEKTGGGLPELRIPFLMGMWGSAFCATLSHYYKEIRPLVKGLAGFEEIDKRFEKKDDELIKLHPIDPGSIPNFALGLQDSLPPTCPQSIFKDDYIDLMDAGMSNNLPIYPLLRQGRDVDIIVCFDASADIRQENWLSVVDGYARQRGLKGWPIGAGWPRQDPSKKETKEAMAAANNATPQAALAKVEEVAGGQPSVNNHGSTGAEDVVTKTKKDSELGYCNVWVGTTLERTSAGEPPQSKRVEPDADWQLTAPEAGITVIYFPLLPNEKVPGVDPATSPYLSTWNFIYTPEQIDSMVALARANYAEGREQTKRTVRAVYERKKARRLKMEGKAEWKRLGRRMREEGDQFR